MRNEHRRYLDQWRFPGKELIRFLGADDVGLRLDGHLELSGRKSKNGCLQKHNSERKW